MYRLIILTDGDVLIVSVPAADLAEAYERFVSLVWKLTMTSTIGIWHGNKLVARVVPGPKLEVL